MFVQKILGCPFADDVLYDTEMGVWVRMDGELAVIGIDIVRAWLTGPFTSVAFKEPGTVVDRGNSVGAAEGPRHFDTVRSPLSGRIVEVNEVLKTSPKLLNREPYGEGWFAKLLPSNLEAEKKELRDISSAKQAIERKIVQMKVRCFAEFPDQEMYEIGSECAGVLVKLDELIEKAPMGTVVHLVSDDVTAEIELMAWSERTHQEIVESRKEGNLFHFIVKKTH